MPSHASDTNFVADVRLDDTDEVLQLPIVKSKLKKLLANAVKKIALLGNPVIPSSDDTLEQFLNAAGKFFGKDPMEWTQVGEPQVTITEEGGKNFIRSTGVFSGIELHMFVEPPYYDERLTGDGAFNEKRVAITTDEHWQEIIREQPWTMSKRRQVLSTFLQAKMECDDLAEEGCHGMWEMSVNKENHGDIRIERLMALLSKVESPNVAVSTMAAAAVWGLATSAGCRRNLSEVDAIPIIVNSIKRTLKMAVFPDPEPGDKPPSGIVTETQRATLQNHLIGALAMLLVDRCCRRPYIQMEPNFATLFTLCRNLDGYRPADAERRREVAAKILTSLIQRDEDARNSLIRTGSLRSVIELLNPQGPGNHMIQFCMASLLATMVLDDPVMELIRDRGEAPLFLEACLVLLTATLDNLHEELERQLGDYYQSDDEPAVYDLALGVRLAEAASQAMWGSAYMCVGMEPVTIKMEHIVELGKMGLDCVATEQLPLSRVCHCITATLASLSSNGVTAQMMLDCPDNLALRTLLTLAEVKPSENFEQAGHVKASATAGIAFLAVHPLGAKGDECMNGPHRKALLAMGAFGTLLRAALTSVGDPECDLIVQQAAAIGLMYMSTMAAAVDPAELAMYAALLMDSDNSEMVEFLMAGMWILLRNPSNRRVLGSSFSANPANNIAKGMMGKLNDAITLHEINDQAHEKAEMLRGAASGPGKHAAAEDPAPASASASAAAGRAAPPTAGTPRGAASPLTLTAVPEAQPPPTDDGSGGDSSGSGGDGSAPTPSGADAAAAAAAAGEGEGEGGLVSPDATAKGGRRMSVMGRLSMAGGPGDERGNRISVAGSAVQPGMASVSGASAPRIPGRTSVSGAVGVAAGPADGAARGATAGEGGRSAEGQDQGQGQGQDQDQGEGFPEGYSPEADLDEGIEGVEGILDDEVPGQGLGQGSGSTQGLLSTPPHAPISPGRRQPGASESGSVGGVALGSVGRVPGGGDGARGGSLMGTPLGGRRDRSDARAVPPGLVDDEREVKARMSPGVRGGGGSAGGPGGAGGGVAAAKRQAQDASKDAGKDNELVKKLDKQLKENWGLETLVAVGESWLPAMLEQDESEVASDVPVLKLFEFLVASICLFMIEEDTTDEPRQLDMFKLSAPPGVRARTWWTVDARAPEPQAAVAAEQERALGILVKIVGMRLGAAWKSLQLGVLTLWNVCSRNAAMERHVVEQGVCARLLDIMNRSSWPHSLRDVAGGCLEFFSERFSNLTQFPDIPLPHELDWPLPKPPTQGLVPAIAAYINLINSKIPLLEYRGSHGIARACYAFPYGCADGREYIKEAKNVVAVLGGVDAVIALMKRVNKRYQDLVTGKKAMSCRHGTFGVSLNEVDEEAEEFVKDMSTLEAQQDIYFVVFAALLNVSILRSVQPMVAKKGLLVLLGTNTMLYSRMAGGAQYVVPATEVEEKLLHLCSSIIQNIATHPQNRTRMYKAELKGSVALDKLIEGAIDEEMDPRLKDVASGMLPPILQRSKTEPNSPVGLNAQRHASGRHAGPLGASSHKQQTSRNTVATAGGGGSSLAAGPSSTSIGSGMGGGRNRSAKRSPNGAVLNASVDTAMVASIRPKVLFPPIVEGGGDEGSYRGHAASSSLGVVSSNTVLPLVKGASQQLPDHRSSIFEEGSQPRGFGNDEQEDSSITSRNRFLSWMTNTFMVDENGELPGTQSDGQRQKTHRRQMWDEHGDWLGNEPETAKALNRLLCRPITHLWMEAPEARRRQGKARWEPVVSEYREAEGDVPLSRPAARLLETKPPKAELELQQAASTFASTGSTLVSGGTFASVGTTGRLGPGLGSGLSRAGMDAAASNDRPGTQQRMNGQVSLTVLKADSGVLRDAEREEEEVLMGTGTGRRWQPGAGGVGGRGGGGGAGGMAGTGVRGGASVGADGGGGADAEGKKGKRESKSVPLKVCLGPKRSRQVISFEDRIIVHDDQSRPLLTMFEHVEGARVSKGLFPSYQLPNGKQAFMYYNGGSLLDEVHVDAVCPPPRPSTVPAALQQTMPLADVLNLISKPPGSAPPFLPYKPVPYLVPLPSHHTLTVKHPESASSSAFGDLREDNLQLIIHAKKIIKTQTSTRVEDIEHVRPEHREPWVLPNSIFKPRVKECDSRSFFDSDATEEKMFERDWQRACAKEKFTGMLSRENKACKSEVKDDRTMLTEVHDVLLRYYRQWYGAFMYYAAGGGSDPYHMSLNSFTTFLDECQICDSDSQFIKRSDCDTIFIVCNFQPDKKSVEAQVNLENAMMRYEFVEALVRLALAKYGKGQATDDVATAVRMLLEQNLVCNLPAGASLVCNEFRQQRLYCEEVDLLLKRHAVILKAIYSRYRLKPPGGGLRTKVMKLDGWLQFLMDAHLVDSQFTIQDAILSYLWSRMMTVDEIRDYNRYISLTFIDFLEAIGRVADMKSLPLESELEGAGYNNILEWSLDKERLEGNDQGQRAAAAGDDSAPAAAASPASEGSSAAASGASAAGPDAAAAAATGELPSPTRRALGLGASGQSELFRTRDSAGYAAPKSRPLYAKLELLLDLVFRRLFWDPSQADVPFNYDALLKLIKKVDKDMGP